MINYFEVLNVSENAEIDVIRSAYKALVKKYHPDNTQISKELAKEKMILINEAYEILMNDVTRAKHIKELHVRDKDIHREVHIEKDCHYEKKHFDFEVDINLVATIIVVISFICCTLYFGPDILRDVIENFIENFKKVINTF